MALVCRALIFAALLAGTAGPVSAATLGVAWDLSPDSTVTGYRVYVGTAPGQHDQSFDVGRLQGTFFYTTAVDGRRYYFAVASLANGITSAKSAEVSAVAGGGTVVGDPPSTPPAVKPPPGIPVEFWLTYREGRRSAVDRSSVASSAVRGIASGLADVTSVAVLPTGGGLLVEAGVRVRAFSDAGVAGLAAFDAPEGTRLAAIAVDPRFETTGFVFVAEARETRDGAEEVFVVRHRLLGGTLGESAAVVLGHRQSVGALTRVAATAAGEVVLVQGEAHALAWDGVREGLWSLGPDATSTVAFSFAPSRDSVATFVRGVVPPVDGGVVADASVAVLDGATEIAVASPTTVFRFDVAAGRLSAGISVADHGVVVSVVSASTNTDYVVVREPAAGDSDTPSFALLRVQHADPP